MSPSSHSVIHLAQRAPNTGVRLKGGPKRHTISNQPLSAGRDEKIRRHKPSAPRLLSPRER